MYPFKDKTILITGASTGIGAEFARELAEHGARNLILVARNVERLEALAREVEKFPGVKAHVVTQDLGAPGAAESLLAAVRARGLTLDVLINNAGFGTYGPFRELVLSRELEEIDLNVGALVSLSHVFLPDVEKTQGGIINVASTAGFQSVPYMAVYGATKAFVLSFSEALWGEYRGRGVRVLALCPGATETPFFEVAQSNEAALGPKVSPRAVVRVGLEAFSKDRPSVVQGAANYVTANLNRLVPRSITIRVTRRLMKPKTDRVLAAKSSAG